MRYLLSVTATFVFLASTADAALHDRGGGLIYDDVLNVTWMQDASYSLSVGAGNPGTGRMNWEQAMQFAMDTSYYDSVRDVTYSDWRLPTVAPINGAIFNTADTYDGSSDAGYTDSTGWVDGAGNPTNELGHLFYVTLGNLGFCAPDSGTACVEQDGWLERKHGPFTNVNTSYYWTGTEFYDIASAQRIFQFGMGNGRSFLNSGGDWHVWLLRDGDVAAAPVPVPAAVWLFVSALIGLTRLQRTVAR